MENNIVFEDYGIEITEADIKNATTEELIACREKIKNILKKMKEEN